MDLSAVNQEQIRDFFAKELLSTIRENHEIRLQIFNIMNDKFAEKEKTEDRFEAMLAEMRRDREENTHRWEELKRDSNEKWEALTRELNEKWEALTRDSNEKWEAMRHESDTKWREMLQEIKDLKKGHNHLEEKYNNTLGALGKRWGLDAEASFRNGLKAILEERFDVKVENFNIFDEEGIVFGHPEQVEMDVIIYNGDIIICEIKSSMSKSDMYTLNRKVMYYEKLHQVTVASKMVISPMVNDYAKRAAEYLGIKVYTSTIDAEL